MTDRSVGTKLDMPTLKFAGLVVLWIALYVFAGLVGHYHRDWIIFCLLALAGICFFDYIGSENRAEAISHWFGQQFTGMASVIAVYLLLSKIIGRTFC